MSVEKVPDLTRPTSRGFVVSQRKGTIGGTDGYKGKKYIRVGKW